MDLGHKPIIIKFAHDRLIVAQLNGLVNVYDALALRAPVRMPCLNLLTAYGSHLSLQATSDHLPLLHAFTHSSEPIRDVQPNPSDRPELVAILRGNVQTGTRVEIVDVKAFSLALTLEVMGSQQAQTCSESQYPTSGTLLSYCSSVVVPKGKANCGWKHQWGTHPIHSRRGSEGCHPSP